MASLSFASAAVLTLLVAVLHVVGGGPVVIGPLMRSRELSDTVKWLSYFTWHDGTVVLLVMAGAFTYVAFYPANTALAVLATATIAAIGCLGTAVALLGNRALLRTPAPYAFNVIALLGVTGILVTPS